MKTVKAQEAAVTILTEIFSAPYLRPLNIGDNKYVLEPTDSVHTSQFDTAGYFNPESDNADALYDIIEYNVGGVKIDAEKVMFFAELILEDFYKTKATPYNDVIHITHEDYTVDNLTPRYIKHTIETSKRLHALLSGQYYDNFTM